MTNAELDGNRPTPKTEPNTIPTRIVSSRTQPNGITPQALGHQELDMNLPPQAEALGVNLNGFNVAGAGQAHTEELRVEDPSTVFYSGERVEGPLYMGLETDLPGVDGDLKMAGAVSGRSGSVAAALAEQFEAAQNGTEVGAEPVKDWSTILQDAMKALGERDEPLADWLQPGQLISQLTVQQETGPEKIDVTTDQRALLLNNLDQAKTNPVAVEVTSAQTWEQWVMGQGSYDSIFESVAGNPRCARSIQLATGQVVHFIYTTGAVVCGEHDLVISMEQRLCVTLEARFQANQGQGRVVAHVRPPDEEAGDDVLAVVQQLQGWGTLARVELWGNDPENKKRIEGYVQRAYPEQAFGVVPHDLPNRLTSLLIREDGAEAISLGQIIKKSKEIMLVDATSTFQLAGADEAKTKLPVEAGGVDIIKPGRGKRKANGKQSYPSYEHQLRAIDQITQKDLSEWQDNLVEVIKEVKTLVPVQQYTALTSKGEALAVYVYKFEQDIDGHQEQNVRFLATDAHGNIVGYRIIAFGLEEENPHQTHMPSLIEIHPSLKGKGFGSALEKSVMTYIQQYVNDNEIAEFTWQIWDTANDPDRPAFDHLYKAILQFQPETYQFQGRKQTRTVRYIRSTDPVPFPLVQEAVVQNSTSLTYFLNENGQVQSHQFVVSGKERDLVDITPDLPPTPENTGSGGPIYPGSEIAEDFADDPPTPLPDEWVKAVNPTPELITELNTNPYGLVFSETKQDGQPRYTVHFKPDQLPADRSLDEAVQQWQAIQSWLLAGAPGVLEVGLAEAVVEQMGARARKWREEMRAGEERMGVEREDNTFLTEIITAVQNRDGTAIRAFIKANTLIDLEENSILYDGHKYANWRRLQRSILRAIAIQASLPPVPENHTRLWRGNRPDEIGQNPSFTNALVGIALKFLKTYNGQLSYVDIPDQEVPSSADDTPSQREYGSTEVEFKEFNLSVDQAAKAIAVETTFEAWDDLPLELFEAGPVEAAWLASKAEKKEQAEEPVETPADKSPEQPSPRTEQLPPLKVSSAEAKKVLDMTAEEIQLFAKNSQRGYMKTIAQWRELLPNYEAINGVPLEVFSACVETLPDGEIFIRFVRELIPEDDTFEAAVLWHEVTESVFSANDAFRAHAEGIIDTLNLREVLQPKDPVPGGHAKNAPHYVGCIYQVAAMLEEGKYPKFIANFKDMCRRMAAVERNLFIQQALAVQEKKGKKIEFEVAEQTLKPLLEEMEQEAWQRIELEITKFDLIAQRLTELGWSAPSPATDESVSEALHFQDKNLVITASEKAAPETGVDAPYPYQWLEDLKWVELDDQIYKELHSLADVDASIGVELEEVLNPEGDDFKPDPDTVYIYVGTASHLIKPLFDAAKAGMATQVSSVVDLRADWLTEQRMAMAMNHLGSLYEHPAVHFHPSKQTSSSSAYFILDTHQHQWDGEHNPMIQLRSILQSLQDQPVKIRLIAEGVTSIEKQLETLAHTGDFGKAQLAQSSTSLAAATQEPVRSLTDLDLWIPVLEYCHQHSIPLQVTGYDVDAHMANYAWMFESLATERTYERAIAEAMQAENDMENEQRPPMDLNQAKQMLASIVLESQMGQNPSADISRIGPYARQEVAQALEVVVRELNASQQVETIKPMGVSFTMNPYQVETSKGKLFLHVSELRSDHVTEVKLSLDTPTGQPRDPLVECSIPLSLSEIRRYTLARFEGYFDYRTEQYVTIPDMVLAADEEAYNRYLEGVRWVCANLVLLLDGKDFILPEELDTFSGLGEFKHGLVLDSGPVSLPQDFPGVWGAATVGDMAIASPEPGFASAPEGVIDGMPVVSPDANTFPESEDIIEIVIPDNETLVQPLSPRQKEVKAVASQTHALALELMRKTSQLADYLRYQQCGISYSEPQGIDWMWEPYMGGAPTAEEIIPEMESEKVTKHYQKEADLAKKLWEQTNQLEDKPGQIKVAIGRFREGGIANPHVVAIFPDGSHLDLPIAKKKANLDKTVRAVYFKPQQACVQHPCDVLYKQYRDQGQDAFYIPYESFITVQRRIQLGEDGRAHYIIRESEQGNVTQSPRDFLLFALLGGYSNEPNRLGIPQRFFEHSDNSNIQDTTSKSASHPSEAEPAFPTDEAAGMVLVGGAGAPPDRSDGTKVAEGEEDGTKKEKGNHSLFENPLVSLKQGESFTFNQEYLQQLRNEGYTEAEIFDAIDQIFTKGGFPQKKVEDGQWVPARGKDDTIIEEKVTPGYEYFTFTLNAEGKYDVLRVTQNVQVIAITPQGQVLSEHKFEDRKKHKTIASRKRVPAKTTAVMRKDEDGMIVPLTDVTLLEKGRAILIDDMGLGENGMDQLKTLYDLESMKVVVTEDAPEASSSYAGMQTQRITARVVVLTREPQNPGQLWINDEGPYYYEWGFDFPKDDNLKQIVDEVLHPPVILPPVATSSEAAVYTPKAAQVESPEITKESNIVKEAKSRRVYKNLPPEEISAVDEFYKEQREAVAKCLEPLVVSPESIDPRVRNQAEIFLDRYFVRVKRLKQVYEQPVIFYINADTDPNVVEQVNFNLARMGELPLEGNGISNGVKNYVIVPVNRYSDKDIDAFETCLTLQEELNHIGAIDIEAVPTGNGRIHLQTIASGGYRYSADRTKILGRAIVEGQMAIYRDAYLGGTCGLEDFDETLSQMPNITEIFPGILQRHNEEIDQLREEQQSSTKKFRESSAATGAERLGLDDTYDPYHQLMMSIYDLNPQLFVAVNSMIYEGNFKRFEEGVNDTLWEGAYSELMAIQNPQEAVDFLEKVEEYVGESEDPDATTQTASLISTPANPPFATSAESANPAQPIAIASTAEEGTVTTEDVTRLAEHEKELPDIVDTLAQLKELGLVVAIIDGKIPQEIRDKVSFPGTLSHAIRPEHLVYQLQDHGYIGYLAADGNYLPVHLSSRFGKVDGAFGGYYSLRHKGALVQFKESFAHKASLPQFTDEQLLALGESLMVTPSEDLLELPSYSQALELWQQFTHTFETFLHKTPRMNYQTAHEQEANSEHIFVEHIQQLRHCIASVLNIRSLNHSQNSGLDAKSQGYFIPYNPRMGVFPTMISNDGNISPLYPTLEDIELVIVNIPSNQ